MGTWAGPNLLLVYWSWSLISHDGTGISESPRPSGTTGPETWAVEQQSPSFEATGMLFRGREGALGLLVCCAGVVCSPRTHPSGPPRGAGPSQGPPRVLAWVVAY